MNHEVTATDPAAVVVPVQRAEGDAQSERGPSGPLSWGVLTWVLEHGGVATAYQPIIDVKRERIVGWEALLRAQHPDIGAISPVALVEAAERHGLLDLLTRRIIEDARSTMVTVRALVRDPLKIHLNLELSQLREAEPLLEWLAELDWPADIEVVAEITERGADQWLPRYEAGATILTNGQVSLAIDDCGSGSSRLSFISSRAWEVVKIDRQLLIDHDERRVVVLRHLVQLLSALNAISVAEGIETIEQLRLVRELGFDEAQGYLLGMPVPGPTMLASLARQGLALDLAE
ncbi:MAG: EAL domain-containing protein [Nocardioides sp.]